jgi:hypothetical protein
LAPGYSATIFTLGGEIEGNWVTGSLSNAITPSNVMMSEMTMDRTGRCMNLLNMVFVLLDESIYCLIS